MPRTSTSGAGENAPKNGIAVVTQIAGAYQPIIVLGSRNRSGSVVRWSRNPAATNVIDAATITSTVAVGSPGRIAAAIAPAAAIAAPMKQNLRVRRISSRSSASSGEPIVVEPDPEGEGAAACVDTVDAVGASKVSGST